MPQNKAEPKRDTIINRWTLCFVDKTLERAYKDNYFEKSIASFRIYFAIVTFLYAAFGFFDSYGGTEFIQIFFVVRYALVVPFMAGVVVFSFFTAFKKHWQIWITSGYVIGGWGISYMLALNPGNHYYYGGLFLVFVSGYFLIKLHLTWAIAGGMLILLFYNLAPLLIETPNLNIFEYYIITNAFYLAANMISGTALYHSQLHERIEFYQRKLLHEKQIEIQHANDNLESKILERTKLLKDRNAALKEQIEKRKQVEQELKISAKKAEESDRLKSTFLSNLSHEIRTPMNGILSFLDLVNDPDFGKAEQAHFLASLETSGQRLLSTMNDIIEISKIESSTLTTKPTEVKLYQTYAKLTDSLALEIREKNLLLVRPDPADSLTLFTDEEMLEKILRHLIKNAIKFTNSGRISISHQLNKDKLQFSISDTGCGIPKERQEAIFKSFVQANDGLTRSHEGAGLGLSICKAYVESLGGSIWLESEPHIGSTFNFTIDYQAV
ncbi:ATP-binding protein [Coraliomargarita sp. W4R53]